MVGTSSTYQDRGYQGRRATVVKVEKVKDQKFITGEQKVQRDRRTGQPVSSKSGGSGKRTVVSGAPEIGQQEAEQLASLTRQHGRLELSRNKEGYTATYREQTRQTSPVSSTNLYPEASTRPQAELIMLNELIAGKTRTQIPTSQLYKVYTPESESKTIIITKNINASPKTTIGGGIIRGFGEVGKEIFIEPLKGGGVVLTKTLTGNKVVGGLIELGKSTPAKDTKLYSNIYKIKSETPLQTLQREEVKTTGITLATLPFTSIRSGRIAVGGIATASGIYTGIKEPTSKGITKGVIYSGLGSATILGNLKTKEGFSIFLAKKYRITAQDKAKAITINKETNNIINKVGVSDNKLQIGRNNVLSLPFREAEIKVSYTKIKPRTYTFKQVLSKTSENIESPKIFSYNAGSKTIVLQQLQKQDLGIVGSRFEPLRQKTSSLISSSKFDLLSSTLNKRRTRLKFDEVTYYKPSGSLSDARLVQPVSTFGVGTSSTLRKVYVPISISKNVTTNLLKPTYLSVSSLKRSSVLVSESKSEIVSVPKNISINVVSNVVKSDTLSKESYIQKFKLESESSLKLNRKYVSRTLPFYKFDLPLLKKKSEKRKKIKGGRRSVKLKKFDVFVLPDLVSVERTERKYAFTTQEQAIAPRLTKKVELLARRSFGGVGGYIPTEQIRIGNVKI